MTLLGVAAGSMLSPASLMSLAGSKCQKTHIEPARAGKGAPQRQRLPDQQRASIAHSPDSCWVRQAGSRRLWEQTP